MKLTLGQIADWIHAEGEFRSEAEVLGYSIDSRTIAAGDLFFAVRGERVDGHAFVEAALANGAAAAVVSQHWLLPDELDAGRLLRVPESEDCVLHAMQTLARKVRERWGALGAGSTGEPRRVIGVTGSAGKTTTKEMISAVLAARLRVLKSAGNLNNHFGLPLQLLKLEAEHEVCVLEMGMNHAGELRALAKTARPDWAVVSNVAPVHLQHFPDGIAGIAAAKRELVEALPAGGVAVLNADDERVRSFATDLEVRPVLYGVSEDAEVRAENLREQGVEGLQWTATAQPAPGRPVQRAEVQLHLLGRHNLHNALAALAVGVEYGVPLEAGAAALAELRPGDKRGEVLHWHGATLINDSYNSNPRALQAMVEALRGMPATRRIVVAGEMLELGPEGGRLHAESGAAMAGMDAVLGVQGLAEPLVRAAAEAGVPSAIFVSSPEEAGRWLQANLRAGDAVLVKGSRGVRLERALALLADAPEPGQG